MLLLRGTRPCHWASGEVLSFLPLLSLAVEHGGTSIVWSQHLEKRKQDQELKSHAKLYSEFKGSLGYMRLRYQPRTLRKERNLLLTPL